MNVYKEGSIYRVYVDQVGRPVQSLGQSVTSYTYPSLGELQRNFPGQAVSVIDVPPTEAKYTLSTGQTVTESELRKMATPRETKVATAEDLTHALAATASPNPESTTPKKIGTASSIFDALQSLAPVLAAAASPKQSSDLDRALLEFEMRYRMYKATETDQGKIRLEAIGDFIMTLWPDADLQSVIAKVTTPKRFTL